MDTPKIEVDDASPRNTPFSSDVEDNPQSSPCYHPDRSPSSRLQLSARCTPLRRKRDGDCTTLSSSCKRAVEEADPNSGRCLITCAPKEDAILTRCHLLPQCSRYDHDLLTKLERAWGLEHDTLHVDTHMNIMLLREDWHKLFDFPRWFLLPSKDVVELFDKHCCTTPKTPIHKLYGNKKVFEYRLIPMRPRIDNIFRYDWPEGVDPPPDLNSVGYTRHTYPFKTLPTLRSHVQPHFVLYNFGQKTQQSFLEYPEIFVRFLDMSLGDASNFLVKLARVYRSWVGHPAPAEASETKSIGPRHGSFGPHSEDDDDNSSPSRFYKRPRRSPSNSGSRAQEQGGGQSNTQLMLRHAANPSIAITPELDYDGTDRDTEAVSHSSSNEADMQVDREPIHHVSVLAWVNQASSAAASEGWERITVNDKQLGRYPEELAHPLQL